MQCMWESVFIGVSGWGLSEKEVICHWKGKTFLASFYLHLISFYIPLVEVKCMPAPFYNLLCAPSHIFAVNFWLHAEILISPNNCCVALLHWDGLWIKHNVIQKSGAVKAISLFLMFLIMDYLTYHKLQQLNNLSKQFCRRHIFHFWQIKFTNLICLRCEVNVSVRNFKITTQHEKALILPLFPCAHTRRPVVKW